MEVMTRRYPFVERCLGKEFEDLPIEIKKEMMYLFQVFK